MQWDDRYGVNRYIATMSILENGLVGAGTKSARLARALGADIASGVLARGERLPPHRALAHRLGCTPGTVSRAYAELERDGLVAGHVGRGTFVTDPRSPVRADLVVREWQPDRLLDLAVNRAPLPRIRAAVAEALSALARSDRLDPVLSYHPGAGLARHRAAVAAWVGHGIPAGRVVVTAGAQHAAWLVLSALASRGDTVLVEAFTYAGFKGLAEELGLRLEPVAMDAEGLLPEALEEKLARLGARWLYCMPTLHNPTTAAMPPGRRRAVLEIVRRHDVRVIEDGTYDALAGDGAHVPLVGAEPERVFHVSSVSKSLVAGLRAGFVVAPAAYVDRLGQTLGRTMWMTPPLGMEVCCGWIESGQIGALLAVQREALDQRRAAAMEVLAGVRLRARGAFLWIDLPASLSAARIVAAAAAAGVLLAPTDAFAVGRAPEADRHLRISLGATATERELREALHRVRPLLMAEQVSPGYW